MLFIAWTCQVLEWWTSGWPRERLTLSRKLNDKAIGDGYNFMMVMSKSHKYNIRKNTRISMRLKWIES